jgi:hypothetical protein
MSQDRIPGKIPAPGGERPDEELGKFLTGNSGARKAASSLKAGAEVGIAFANLDGDWRVRTDDAGQLAFEAGKAVDPDFSLRIPPGAARSLLGRGDSDLGELGIAFFELIASHEQDLKIHVTVHSGLVKLTRRGWLGVLASGGPKVVMWMAKKGLRGPGAIATALGKLKG